MYSIITMIKLILVAFLCFALSGPVYGTDDEQPDCQIAGNARIKLSINVPEGACGCDSDEDEDSENRCLGLDNSQKISDAVLNVLDKNGHSYDVIEKLMIHRFIYGLEYNDFSDNIKNNYFNFEGYADLKELVQKYRVCKKECKVYYTLRKALRENSASAGSLSETVNGDGTKTLTVDGNFIILSDTVKDVQEKIVKDSRYTKVVFKASTFVSDVHLMNALWHGKVVRIEAENVIAGTKTSMWNVEACKYRFDLNF